jgi:molybdopterin converting factor small subunit
MAKITVNVLFFAVARELAGTGRSELSLEPGSTTQTLRQSLAERFPKLAPQAFTITLAVNMEVM